MRARTSKYQTGNSAFNRRRHLRRQYGLDEDQYEAKLAAQHGLCALCGKPPEGDKKLMVDHDHETKKFRGLVHQHCNSLLGFAREDTAVLLMAIDYLVRHKG